MQTIVITGGTGFVGKSIVQKLAERGDAVTVLSRSAQASAPAGIKLVRWTPESPGGWFSSIDGADALIHLAGEPVVGQRWTDTKKRAIYNSRVVSTRNLVAAIRAAPRRPRVLVSASAIGFYGARNPDEILEEGSPPGKGFLAEVTQDWERAAEEATSLGVRVIRMRIGIVLGKNGGALQQMLLPFKMFAGGPIGSGHQVLSWIHLDDLARLALFALDHDEVRGPLNATAPHPTPMNEFAHSVGRALGRPSWLRVPEAAVRAIFGEAAEAVLTGQRVVPHEALQRGFSFRYPHLEEALTSLVLK